MVVKILLCSCSIYGWLIIGFLNLYRLSLKNFSSAKVFLNLLNKKFKTLFYFLINSQLIIKHDFNILALLSFKIVSLLHFYNEQVFFIQYFLSFSLYIFIVFLKIFFKYFLKKEEKKLKNSFLIFLKKKYCKRLLSLFK